MNDALFYLKMEIYNTIEICNPIVVKQGHFKIVFTVS
jgi:hypothetical protein